MENLENNETIAEFMGIEEAYNPNGNDWVLKTTIPNTNGDTDILESCKSNELKYHNSWDWLMTVVDKIESFTDDNKCCKYNVKIEQCWVEIIDNQNSDEIVSVDGDDKILSTYKAVVEFIKNYN